MLDLSPTNRAGITHLLDRINAESVKWSKRVARGRPPLTPAEADRLAAYIQNAQATLELTRTDAQIHAWTTDALRPLLVDAQNVTDQLEATAARASAAFSTASGIPGTRVDAAAVHSIARRSQDAITHDWERMTSDTQRRIAEAITRNHLQGDNPETTARELADAIGGEVERATHRARVILRTEAKQVYDDVSEVMMTEHAAQLQGWKWDARTDACVICLALDGRLFPARAPMLSHHMCRCVPVPVLLDDRKYQHVTPGDWPTDHPDPDIQDARSQIGLRPNSRWREYWSIDTSGRGNLRRPNYAPRPTTDLGNHGGSSPPTPQ